MKTGLSRYRRLSHLAHRLSIRVEAFEACYRAWAGMWKDYDGPRGEAVAIQAEFWAVKWTLASDRWNAVVDALAEEWQVEHDRAA